MSVYPCEDFARDNNKEWKHQEDCLVCKALDNCEYINPDFMIESGESISNEDIKDLLRDQCVDCDYEKRQKELNEESKRITEAFAGLIDKVRK